MAQASIQLPPDGLGKKSPAHTFNWGTEGTVHAQGIFICDSSGNVVALTGTRLQVDAGTVPVTGTFWPATQPVSAASLPLPTGAAQEHATAASPASVRLSDGAAYLGSTNGRLNVSDGGVGLSVTGPLTDTQLRASPIPARPPKDTGRTRVSIGFQAVAPATADTLLSLVKTSAGAAAAGATSIAVTAAKTLRITAVTFSLKAGAAAAAFGTMTLRSNPAGATVIGSQSELRLDVGNTEATVGAARSVTVGIPDGMEFSGTQTLGVSLAAQAVTNVVSIAVLGFEY